MKYKIALLATLFLGFSKTKQEPDLEPGYAQNSIKELELEQRICEEANKICIIGGRHSPPDYQALENYRRLKIELMELSQYRIKKQSGH